MILGHAVPMPMALRTRSYDDDFYAWVAQAASRRPYVPTTQGWHQSGDAVATTVKPLRRYEELFGKDD